MNDCNIIQAWGILVRTNLVTLDGAWRQSTRSGWASVCSQTAYRPMTTFGSTSTHCFWPLDETALNSWVSQSRDHQFLFSKNELDILRRICSGLKRHAGYFVWYGGPRRALAKRCWGMCYWSTVSQLKRIESCWFQAPGGVSPGAWGRSAL